MRPPLSPLSSLSRSLTSLPRYACGLDFSPDGSYIVSGDSEGKLFFWDFVTAKNVRKLVGGHKGPVSTVIWHPHQPSLVASGGWDGKVLLWD